MSNGGPIIVERGVRVGGRVFVAPFSTAPPRVWRKKEQVPLWVFRAIMDWADEVSKQGGGNVEWARKLVGRLI